ncbi:MAG: thermonuclease family protein [Boseongicola sp.]|nr:thermonuclease family protein [Boseongicola sp.]MDD9979034.1 thermonuclease family protein [Boseongicola sp.]
MVYFLGFLTLVAIFLILHRTGQRFDGPASKTLEETSRQAVITKERKTAPAPRFDPSTAKHLDKKRILEGAAYIVDGDTLRIKNIQVRLFGIDAPELNHPYGRKAMWALRGLCKGKIVRAEITDEDKYGRTVACCFLPDGRDLSAEMVSRGWAIDWPKYSGGKYRNLETKDARKKLFLADARQNGRMHVWRNFDERKKLAD